MNRDRDDSGAEATGTEVSGTEVVGAEVTRAEVTRRRGGSRAEVSVNPTDRYNGLCFPTVSHTLDSRVNKLQLQIYLSEDEGRSCHVSFFSLGTDIQFSA